MKKFLILVLLGVGLSLGQAQADQKTFDDFGGREGLVRIMDDFMVNLIADPRTRPFFDNDRQVRIKAMLVEQMCELLEGGCTYSGKDMKSAHANMKVNRAAFNALVENFQIAMDKNGVPFRSQNKLLAKLAPMYRDIETTTGEAIPPVFETPAVSSAGTL